MTNRLEVCPLFEDAVKLRMAFLVTRPVMTPVESLTPTKFGLFTLSVNV